MKWFQLKIRITHIAKAKIEIHIEVNCVLKRLLYFDEMQLNFDLIFFLILYRVQASLGGLKTSYMDFPPPSQKRSDPLVELKLPAG